MVGWLVGLKIGEIFDAINFIVSYDNLINYSRFSIIVDKNLLSIIHIYYWTSFSYNLYDSLKNINFISSLKYKFNTNIIDLNFNLYIYI